MNIRKNIVYRIYACFLVMVMVGAAIVIKAYQIQTADDGRWAELAETQNKDLRSIPAERGNIYSYDDRLFATTMPQFELRMDLASDAMTDKIFSENVDSLAISMAGFFRDKSVAAYKKQLMDARKRGDRYHLIRRKVDYLQLREIKQWPLFRLGKYKGGLIVEVKQRRELPYGNLAKRTVGNQRLNAQSIGLEAQFNEDLSGKEGRRLMQRIAGGTWIPVNDETALEPQNGYDLYTTIDVNLQDVAQASLQHAMEAHRADHGCVVVMEVETGAIRAIANLGRLSDGRYGEIYNYAVGKRTEPGSTFKVASMLALLEDGHIQPEDSVDINKGRASFYGYEMVDAGGWSPHNWIPAWKVFAISSNVGVAKFADAAYAGNKQGLYSKFAKYHLTEKTGISIPGEASPDIKDPAVKAWSKLSVPWMSIGYEVQVTPLQTLVFYNAIANGGKMVRPRLVERVVDRGRVVRSYDREVIDPQISTPEAIADITGMMVKVVEEGTARRIFNEHYQIAGKTGTAKLYDSEQGFINEYQASFAGFYPADAPKYSCVVVIQGPSNGLSHGGSVAAPVFREIADKVMSVDMDMQPAFNTVAETHWNSVPDFSASVSHYQELAREFGIPQQEFGGAEYVQVRWSTDSTLVTAPVDPADNTIPDVSGMTLDEALYWLENAGLRVRFNGKGKVVRQSREPGTAVQEEMTIELKLG